MSVLWQQVKDDTAKADLHNGKGPRADNSLTNPISLVGNVVNNVMPICVGGNASAVRVTSLTVVAIPLPAAGRLVPAGLSALATMRRRKAA
jgi:hypothetical protein